jgi:hypothetical protein
MNIKKSFNYKLIALPLIGIINFKINFMNSKYFQKKVYCGNSEEEPNPSAKSINSRIRKIEQKLDYLISKEGLKIDIKDFPKLNKKGDSLISTILDETTWKRNYMLKTEEGFDINDLIQAGVDNSDHPIGLCAPSKDAYFTFEDILIKAASQFHNRNISLNKFEKENYLVTKNILSSSEDYLKTLIERIQITSNRNIEGHAFASKITRSGRREVARSVLSVLKAEESNIFDENGKFLSVGEELKNINEFNKACGFFRDWPDGRLMYLNKGISLIVNEEDHIKLLGQFEKDPITQLILYLDLLDKLQSKLELCYDDNLGYLNSIVNNLGSATYFKFSVKCESSKIENFQNHFKKIAELSLDYNQEKGTFDISNNSSFYTITQFLIDLISAKNIIN